MAAQQEALRWRYGDVDDGNFALRGRGSVPVLVSLLVILVCFVAVCLYLRWACHRYYRTGSASLPPRYSATSSSSTFAARGLDDAAIAAFPVTVYRPQPANGADDADAARQCCPICLGEFAEGDKVKALPRCGHGFHPDCVDPWLRTRASCPLCRASLLAEAKPDVVGSEAV